MKFIEFKKEKGTRKRCNCITMAKLVRYANKGTKSAKYWKPCPVHNPENI